MPGRNLARSTAADLVGGLEFFRRSSVRHGDRRHGVDDRHQNGKPSLVIEMQRGSWSGLLDGDGDGDG